MARTGMDEATADLVAGLDYDNQTGTSYPYGWQLLRCPGCGMCVSPQSINAAGGHSGCSYVILPDAAELRRLGRVMRGTE